MANKQPFYHVMAVLFTGTADVSDKANSQEFKVKLEKFLKKELGSVVAGSLEMDGPVTAEPGDPSDLM